MMSNQEKSIFDFQARAYDAWFEQEGRFIFASEVKALQQILPSLPRPWLEVGTGSGRFLQALGIDFGLDPSGKLLEIARNRNAPVFQGTGEQMPFKSSIFGTAFLITSLCFVSSPGEVLREAARLLKDEGKLVLGAILRESHWGQLYRKKKEAGHQLYQHATFYSYDELNNLLKQAGFYPEKVTSTLRQNPGEVNHTELPQPGFSPQAGFTVILAGKLTSGR